MINYWFIPRPKRKLNSIPEVLTTFAEVSLNQQWSGKKNTQIDFENVIEEAGLKRKGERRDRGGSGGRTYAAWLESLGLIFKRKENQCIMLTLAGESIMDGKPPVEILKNQVLKFQYPSSYSISQGVDINRRFKIRPFRFILQLLTDPQINHLSLDELAFIVITEAENESTRCFEHVKSRIIEFRNQEMSSLSSDFYEKYHSTRSKPETFYNALRDVANTMCNWVEYTQLAGRNINGDLVIFPEAVTEVNTILATKLPFIDNPADHEYFQRKYGIDPYHYKDTRNLAKTKTITPQVLAEQRIRSAFITLSATKPIVSITTQTIETVAKSTGIKLTLVEDTLQKLYPYGAIGAFNASYFEMAFKGRENAIDFELATTELFIDVFQMKAQHLGQMGSTSTPDVLLISDKYKYQGLIDNKAYSEYSISGDHHNRMVHNYIEKINNYSTIDYPVRFFLYIAGGFTKNIDVQIKSIVDESGVHGSCITVSTFLKMVENQTTGKKRYSEQEILNIFTLDRQVRMSDL